MEKRTVVVVQPENEGGMIWTADDGVRYAIWILALDAKSGVPLLGTTPTRFGDLKGFAIHAFESMQAAADWVILDEDSRCGCKH
jgi:hypothetical protein